MVGAAVAGLLGAAALAGCSGSGDGGSTCTGEKCDEEATFAEQLEGKSDPIANLLRTFDIDDEGFTELDFATVLFGIAEAQGCGVSSVATFSVSDDLITEGEPFPRLVSVACKDDNSKASEAFFAASFEKFDDNDEPTGEIDVHDVEMFAWDATAAMFTSSRSSAANPNWIDPWTTITTVTKRTSLTPRGPSLASEETSHSAPITARKNMTTNQPHTWVPRKR